VTTDELGAPTPPPLVHALMAKTAATRRKMRSWLPEGRALPDSTWQRRHRTITGFALIQAVGVALFGLMIGRPVPTCVIALIFIGAPGLLGLVRTASRRLRTLSTVVSLMFASVMAVDLAHGAIEAHFHFFVMIGVVSLYQDWSAFGLCVLITVVHHATMGTIDPKAVFAGSAEQRHPVEYAFIHGAFILAASITHLLAWRANEQQELSDSLTRLANRTHFTERLERLLAANDEPVAVLFVDLDNFKNINDSGGHHVGDAALVHTARCISGAIRADDLAARIGGDDFAIVMSTTSDGASAVYDRIAKSLRAPMVVDGREIFVHASVGIADTRSARARNAGDLLREADLAMYVAKSTGRNRSVTYSEAVAGNLRQQAELVADIGHALARGEFEIVYQPAVLPSNGFMCGVEALLRWHHPERGLVSPVEFIPVAEKTGEIRAIGAWVLSEATRQVACWRATVPGCADLEVAVNLSPVQLRDADLLEVVARTLTESGLPADALTLEVTESMLLSDLDLARRQLDAVRKLGAKVSIDDFGTGYSSLSYLAKLPADQVKIDRSFVSELHADDGSVALVRGIIDMARALDLDIQAEGVEDAGQEKILYELGCPRAQGYFYSRPLSVDAFVDYAANRVLEREIAVLNVNGLSA
jgi:diguanylate cyclase (GGDEF)-like protein